MTSTFPVDDTTLDLLWTAMNPGPEAERSSLYDLLELLSEMHHGTAGEPEDLGDGVVYVPGTRWHPHDVIAALITEIRRLRTTPDGPNSAPDVPNPPTTEEPS